MSDRATSRTVARDASGFTLIEILIAVAILGVLSSAALGTWRIGMKAQVKAQEALTANRRREAVQSLMMRQVASMIPLKPWTQRGTNYVFFQGEPRGVRFLSRYSLQGRTQAGLVVAEYQLLDTATGRQLTYLEYPLESVRQLDGFATWNETSATPTTPIYQPLAQTPAGVLPAGRTAPTVLIENVGSCELQYLVPQPPSQETVWTTAWTGASGVLPSGVSLCSRVEAAESSNTAPTGVLYVNAPTRNLPPRLIF